MKNRRANLAVAAIVAVLGLVVFKGLGSATVYFRTAGEAVEQRDSLGTRRFRIEGVVVPGSVQTVGQTVNFAIEDGATVKVVHQGDPPELFQPNIPVVLEGRFTSKTGDAVFASDRIMIKHSSEYEEANPKRVKDYVGKTPTSTRVYR